MRSTSLEYLEVPISTEQMENLLLLQHQILSQIASGDNYQQTLNNLCDVAESILPNSVASIMLYDRNKEQVEVIAAPNLPPTAKDVLNEITPSENTGSCGTAIFKNAPQFVCDTRNDPRWQNDWFQSFANTFGILACWSIPIKGNNNFPLGSFALSIMERRQPSKFHKKLLEVCSDIVSIIIQRQDEERRLVRLAHYDALTQLPNRTLFIDRFEQALVHSKRTETMIGVCFLDLDNFKPINDNFGHDVGDKLLIEVAGRIKATIREEDTVSRQGGDEFTFLFRDIESYAQCEDTVNRIHQALQQPYMIDGIQHVISASSGISLYPIDDGDIDTLIRHADQEMYKVKQSGRNKYSLFNSDLDEKTITKNRRLSEIEEALINNEFKLFYQPKVNMTTGHVYGVEALIRWFHPTEGMIFPLDFLPLIERTDLEIKVGNWVTNNALQQLNTWREQGIEIEASINISSYHLLSNNFFVELNTALDKYPSVNSSYLQLEILESSALGDLQAITTILKACQNTIGVSVALDDFGTGYSSLTHLKNLPANIIKIDQNFVRDMLDDPNDYAIINGVIGLAGAFNRQVIAEGVETTSHGLMLLTMGCENAQGYGIAKPMPADDFENWLEHYKPNQAWLSYSAKPRTDKDNKLTLYKLASEQWLKHFKKNTLASPDLIEIWPIMDNRRCHCGQWIKRARQEKLFEPQILEQLELAHEHVHSTAHSLLIKYQDEPFNNIEVDDNLVLLEIAVDKMSAILGL